MTPKELAILFHNYYEELAPEFGYKTRKETKEFVESSSNGQLMIAVCNKILQDMNKQVLPKIEEEKRYYKCRDCGEAVEHLSSGRCHKCDDRKRDIDWLNAYDNCYGDD